MPLWTQILVLVFFHPRLPVLLIGLHELLKGFGIERLALQKFGGDGVQHVAPLVQNFSRVRVRRIQNGFHLFVHFTGGLLAAVTFDGAVAACGEKRIDALSAVEKSDGFAHAIHADHLAGNGGGVFEIVLRSGGDFGENQLLGGTSAEQAFDFVQQLLIAHEGLVAIGRLKGAAEGAAAARDDADFPQDFAVLGGNADKSMAHFVVGDAQLLFVAEAAALAFGTGDDLFDGIFQITLTDRGPLMARSKERGLVDYIREVGAGKPGRFFGNLAQERPGTRASLAGFARLWRALSRHSEGRNHTARDRCRELFRRRATRRRSRPSAVLAQIAIAPRRVEAAAEDVIAELQRVASGQVFFGQNHVLTRLAERDLTNATPGKHGKNESLTFGCRAQ